MLLTRYISQVIVAFGLIIFVALMWGSPVSAQQESSLQISPAIVDIGVQPGTTSQAMVRLTNLSNEPLALSADSRTLSPEDEVVDPAIASRYDASSWVSMPEKDVLIGPRDSREVQISITTPADAVPGGHYALTIFRILTGSQPDGSGVAVSPEAAVVMLISVPGDVEERIEVTLVPNKSLLFGSAVNLEREIRNIGNSHITPIMTTEFIDADGRVIDSIAEPVQILLPNTKRTINIAWDSGGRLGTYSAKTTVSYGTPSQIVDVQTSNFSILPTLKQLLFWFAVLVVGLKIIHLTVRNQQAQRSKGAKVDSADDTSQS